MKRIIDSYFPKITTTPFQSTEEERQQFLRFLDLLCLISVQQAENEPEESVSRVGTLFTNEDLMRAMEPHEMVSFPGKENLRQVYQALLQRANSTLEQGNIFAPISRLFCYGLSQPIEQLAFLLALAPKTSEKYLQIYANLIGKDADMAYPTVGLCLDMGRLFLTKEENDMAVLMNESSLLNTVLLTEAEDYSSLIRLLSLKKIVYKWMRQSSVEDAKLTLVGEYLTPAEAEEYVCHEDVLQELMDVFVSQKGVVELSGMTGCGKRFLLSRMSDITNQPIIAVDGIRLFGQPESEQTTIIDELCVHGALLGSIIYLYNIRGDEPQVYGVTTRILNATGFLVIGCEKMLSDGFYRGVPSGVYRILVPKVSMSAQHRLWEEAVKSLDAVFDQDVDLWELVSKYTMTPGRIFAAVSNAIQMAEPTPEGFLLGKELLEEQIRRICSVGFGENAKKITSVFEWKDLIIEEESKKLLRMAMNRVRYKSRVNDDYGFGAKLPYGKGISIVLYGSPGTGKTMAAGVLARELGLDLYRIDLSQLSSKYIGETEKNLGAIFDTAESTNVILFFDEADSVFAKRTDVSSSNDRHANEQTGYLLQRIEEYPGISILATNNMQNFDAAFKRRMTYLIPIGIPDEKTRENLWRSSFPGQAPLAEDVDFGVLASAVELSGSSIKSSALGAAYMAAAEDRAITMEDIAVAVDIECVKVGKLGVKNDILSAMLKKGNS